MEFISWISFVTLCYGSVGTQNLLAILLFLSPRPTFVTIAAKQKQQLED